jgi:hypothetical protein
MNINNISPQGKPLLTGEMRIILSRNEKHSQLWGPRPSPADGGKILQTISPIRKPKKHA